MSRDLPGAACWRSPVAIVVIIAFLATLTGAPRAAGAAGTAPNECDRTAVVLALQTGGAQVRAGAEQALLGTAADVCAFLATGWAARGQVDDRLSVNQTMAAGGTALRAAAQQALDSADPDALGTFLESGWRQPRLTDLRVRVNQVMAAGGAQVRTAAQRALDAGTAEALQAFVDTGWRQPYLTDQRLRINQIYTDGGPEVRVVAQQALDAGTVDAYTRFIDTDWGVAAARDQETQTITDLVSAAQDAGDKATRETNAAKDQAERAVAEAAAARQAAIEARDAAARAGHDAAAAGAAARRAADAANRAAQAAQQAVGAARAASAAAQVAAAAGARAAAAASRAGQAASKAYHSAALAALDASKATAARQAAQMARQIAAGAQRSAIAAAAAGDAARAAVRAALSAAAAGQHAADAASASAAAGDYAAAAGADASLARAAAASAQANAARANRAANAAVAFANIAANAAYAARDAANRAVADANAAAAAAEDAANHAGQSANAAALATAHANAALQAAQAAVDAANQAQTVYNAARTAEAVRIQVAFEEGDESARAALADANRLASRASWDATQQQRRSAEVNRLITEARDPATPAPQALTDARKVAVALSGADGSWTRTAASDALGGSDPMLMEFVRTGIGVAAGQDDRATLIALMANGSDAMRTAAQAALDGSDAAVATFLQTRDYPGRLAEDRLTVNQIQAAATAAGDTVTVQQAQRALDTGTGPALRQFVDIGQYSAAASDARVKVNQILADPNAGPELHAAAQIALDGPTAFLTQYLGVGQYAAAQRDQNSAAHDQVVSALLTQALEIAADAVKDAMEAQSAAATARGAAGDAARYAQQAIDSANRAAGFAQQAQQSAVRARDAANRAAASARTAKSAASAANAAARRANASALWAQASAQRAASYATSAYEAASRAYRSAIAAGRDAQAAVIAANQARDAAMQRASYELGIWVTEQGRRCTLPGVDTQKCLASLGEIVKNPARVAYVNGNACGLVFQPGSQAYKACLGDVLSPTFELDQNLVAINAFLQMAAAWYAGIAIGAGAVAIAAYGFAACGSLCAALLEFVAPALSPELVGVPLEGFGMLAGSAFSASLAAVLEHSLVQARAENAAFSRLMGVLKLCAPGNSFVAGTPVLLADGTSRAIQDLRAGDRVLSTDPVSNVTDAQPIAGTITGTGVKNLVDVTVAGPVGSHVATLTATANHPFWVANLRTWVGAGQLRAGQWLRAGGGSWIQISSVRARTETTTVYNLTVARHHTYYAVAGTTPILVHNSSCANYSWAPVPAPLGPLPPALWWNASKGTPTIGRLRDTGAVDGLDGYTFLSVDGWTIQKNDAWIQSIIDQRGTVYVGSPTAGTYWSSGRKEPTVFAREIQQLTSSGYRWVGDYLVPPPL